jgi:hypothetical protein
MAKITIKDDRKKFDSIIKEVELANNSFVSVGFQDDVMTHAQNKQGRKKKAGLSIAQIAAQNEYGTEHIPARSFMRTSFDENFTKINKLISLEYNKIVKGESTTKKSLGLIGLYMNKLIVNKIRSIYYPPNAPSTIKEKKSSKPLIDFGQMVASVTSKVHLR